MSQNADRRGRAKSLPEPEVVQKVYLKSKKKTYEVVGPHQQPRSYILKGPDEEHLRRNRRHFLIIPDGETVTPYQEEPQEEDPAGALPDEELQDEAPQEEATPMEPRAATPPPIRVSSRSNKGVPPVL